MPAALTKAQIEQLKLLCGAAAGTLPKTISQDSTEFSYDALRQLCEAGMMTAGKFQPIAGPGDFMNPRITLRGGDHLAELEQLCVPGHASEPATNPSNSHKDWHEGIVGKIGIGMVIAVLSFLAIYLITHRLGLSL